MPGEDGNYAEQHQVYGKNVSLCVVVALQSRNQLGDGGTHFCPHCQKGKVNGKIIGLTGGIAASGTDQTPI